MKVIHIPEYKTNLLFFEKSGSSLMAGFFKFLLDWKEIQITDTKFKCKNILFVRNPLERLISVFYHLNIIKGNSMRAEEKIKMLDKFLDEYVDKCTHSHNPHLHPQLIGYEWEESDVVIKIETIQNEYERIVRGYKASSNINFNTTLNFFDTESYVKKFGKPDFFLIENIGIPLDEKDRMFAVTLYGWLLNNLSSGHHHNESKVMLEWLKKGRYFSIIDKLKTITKVEMDLLGYYPTNLL